MKPIPPGHTETSTREPQAGAGEEGIYQAPTMIPLDERRYHVGEERARGGIGRIIEARDTLLRRPIALKQLLRPDSPAQMASFMHEAIITARLQHPSIVPVYDAGMRGSGEPYYAMPLVPGRNLHEVIAAAPTLSERLALLPHVQAVADAIAYAHDQHVVHRDLKPANVLVGPFGETVVIDWGLAKDLDAGEDLAGETFLEEHGLVTVEATRTGVARGTPAYMPPEQARGQAVDARSDVYALGAMLYHLLAGRPPHDRAHPAAAGPPPALDSVEPRAPRDLVSIVAKAMAPVPDDRYQSAGQLALDLRRFATGQLVGARRYRPWTRALRFLRRHRVTAAAMLLVAAITLAIAIPVAYKAAAVPACGGDEALVAEVWNPTRAAAIRRQLGAIAGPAGVAQWDRAAPVFDAYAARWAKLRRQSCEATRVEHVQSDSVFDRRLYCFDRRRVQLDGIATTLARLESVPVALGVPELAADLPKVEDCASASLLKDAWIPPLEKRAAVKEAYQAFDAARALSREVRYREALAAYQALEPRAKELAFPVLDAELQHELAYAAQRMGEWELGHQAHERSAAASAALGRADWVFAAEGQLMIMEANRGQFDRALARKATLENLARLSPDPNDAIQLHGTLAKVYQFQGRDEEALAESRLETESMPTDGSYPESDAHREYGDALRRLGKYDQADAELKLSIAINEKRFGPDDPAIAFTLNSLGNLAASRGRWAEALVHFKRSLALREAVAGGQDNAIVAIAAASVAEAQLELGDLDAALASHERAVALLRKYHAETSPALVQVTGNKAKTLLRLGRYDEAEATLRPVLAVQYDPKAPVYRLFIESHTDLGEILLAKGSAGSGRAAQEAYAAAVAACDPAVDLATRAAFDLVLARALVVRARGQLALGRRAPARSDAERALERLRADPRPDPEPIRDASTVLAEILLAERQPAAAIALLEPLTTGDDKSLVHGRAAFALARAYVAIGRLDDGMALARRQLPDLAAMRDARAAVLAQATQAWLDALPAGKPPR